MPARSSPRSRTTRSAIFCALIGAVTLGSPLESILAQDDGAHRVQVVRPERKTLVRSLPEKPGEILPAMEAILYSMVTGVLSSIEVDIGDAVKKGQVLAVLAVPDLEADLVRSEAELAAQQATVRFSRSGVAEAEAKVNREQAEVRLSEVRLNRAKALQQDRAKTDAQVEEMELQLATARAQAAMAVAAKQTAVEMVHVEEADLLAAAARVTVSRTRVEFATIRAPFAGVVTKRFVDPGAVVVGSTSSGRQAIVTVKDLSTVRTYVQIPESDLEYVHVGGQPTLVCRAYPNRTFIGKITRLAQDLDPRTRTMTAEVIIENADALLYAGMFASVSFELIKRENVLTLPAGSLLGGHGEFFVFSSVGGICKSVPVSIGLDDGETVEITGGLEGNEMVVLAGKGQISPGDRLDPVID